MYVLITLQVGFQEKLRTQLISINKGEFLMFKDSFNQIPSNVNNSQKINLKDKWELDYWSNRLHTTPSTLKKTISKVGPLLSAVKKELEK